MFTDVKALLEIHKYKKDPQSLAVDLHPTQNGPEARFGLDSAISQKIQNKQASKQIPP